MSVFYLTNNPKNDKKMVFCNHLKKESMKFILNLLFTSGFLALTAASFYWFILIMEHRPIPWWMWLTILLAFILRVLYVESKGIREGWGGKFSRTFFEEPGKH